tara:strand:+ start:1136 stop:1303 length:168 start_codon:yes stop_codon:yes gene_type:complete
MAREFSFYGIYKGEERAISRAKKMNPKKYKVKIVRERDFSGSPTRYFSLLRRRKF